MYFGNYFTIRKYPLRCACSYWMWQMTHIFARGLHLRPYYVWAAWALARLRLAWALAARKCDKYQNIINCFLKIPYNTLFLIYLLNTEFLSYIIIIDYLKLNTQPQLSSASNLKSILSHIRIIIDDRKFQHSTKCFDCK